MSSPALRQAGEQDRNRRNSLVQGRFSSRAERLRLLNLRPLRSPSRPWHVAAGELIAEVSHQPLPLSISRLDWRLQVDVDAGGRPWKLISVTARTPGVIIDSAPGDSEARSGPRRIGLSVRAPMFVPTPERNPREQVTLTIRYETGGRTRTQEMDVDFRSTVGDRFRDANASGVALLAERYLTDPVIESLVSSARPYPLGTVRQEVERLKRWLAFGPGSIAEDPSENGASPSGYSHYALSPTETSRYGGDCEDWSILSAAYLARRGFRVSIAYVTGHIWVVARDRDGSEVAVDFRRPEIVSGTREHDAQGGYPKGPESLSQVRVRGR